MTNQLVTEASIEHIFDFHAATDVYCAQELAQHVGGRCPPR